MTKLPTLIGCWLALPGLPATAQTLRSLTAPGLSWATFDHRAQRIVASGYDHGTWEFDGTTWFARPDFGARPGLPWYPPGAGELQILSFDDVQTFRIDVRDGHRWRQRHPLQPPLQRHGMAVVHDPVRGELLGFGGAVLGLGTALAETWTFDGAQWQQRFPLQSPPPRILAGVAFDAIQRRVVLFGGSTAAGRLDDTWSWDGTNWQQVVSSSRPGPRDFAAMTYDSIRQRVVLVVGRRSPGAPTDHWEFDGQSWLAMPALPQAMADLDPPIGLAFDPIRRVTTLVGGSDGDTVRGDVWAYDGSAWTPRAGLAARVSPPSGSTLAADPGGNGVLLFGSDFLPPIRSDLRACRNGVWTTLASGGPGPRTMHSMWTQNGATYVFGGFDSSWNPRNDTWRWNGSSWSQLSTATTPPAFLWQTVAFAPGLGHAVLLGTDSNQVVSTWMFDGSQWAPVGGPGMPPAGPSTSAHDPIRNRVVVFATGAQGAASTWEWNGSQWQRIATVRTPAVRGGLAFDATLGRPVLAGFSPQPRPRLYLWTFDGLDWTPLPTIGDGNSHTPLEDLVYAATTDPNGRLVFATSSGLMQRVAAAAEVLDFGVPCGRDAGELRVRTAARLGSADFALDVVGVRPGQPLLLLGGTQASSLPLFGCNLLVGGNVTVAFTIATRQGTAAFPVPVPTAPTLVGLDAYWQGIQFGANPVLATTGSVRTRIGN
ncbi:MAG: hypothetical protein MUC36_18550 [Planctomycetes bacterium]|nr:hypothetical protein [Planctomycetota bacterium]